MTESFPILPSKQKVVFVVDDEEVIANTLAIILNQADFDAHAFFTGQAAIDSLGKLQPDLLIINVVMPGMNGDEAAVATRAKRPQCKILLFSGQAVTMELLEEARAKGHEFEVMAKPIDPPNLLAKICAATLNVRLPSNL